MFGMTVEAGLAFKLDGKNCFASGLSLNSFVKVLKNGFPSDAGKLGDVDRLEQIELLSLDTEEEEVEIFEIWPFDDGASVEMSDVLLQPSVLVGRQTGLLHLFSPLTDCLNAKTLWLSLMDIACLGQTKQELE